jgi:hypothetical protein
MTRAVNTALAGAGGVLQVVSGYNSGKVTTNATSFTALATSPSITPISATSKILVSLSTNIARQGTTGNAFFAVYRNGTTSLLQSGQLEHFGFWNDYSAYAFTSMTWQYLDSPATSSAVYYQIQGKTDGSAISAIVGGRGLDEVHTNGVIWTLMEIAG